AHGIRAIVVLALVAFLVTGTANIVIVLAVSFLYGTAEVFADTTSSTLLPMMVAPADLGVGNARLQAGFLVANQLAGPPLGAFLFAVGTFWPFLAQVLAVSVALVLISRIGRQPVPPRASSEEDPAPQTHQPVRRDIAEGVRWAWRNKPVRTLIVIILAFNVTCAAPWGILVLYATEHLGMGPVGFSALTTAWPIGGLPATLSVGWRAQRASAAELALVCP